MCPNLPYHLLDTLREEGGRGIGSTKKGIGPCYEDKVARLGVRVADYLDPAVFRGLVEQNLKVRVLFESAQGAMLDLDFGTYPFVTSSNPVAGGACAGAGVGPSRIGEVLGVTKAYTTRVGLGPFPTEVDGHVAHYLREKGKEYGATTGRREQIEAEPVYETLPGWSGELGGIRRYAGLPKAARGYVAWVERRLGVPVSIVSVGRSRAETIAREPSFAWA